MKIIKKLPIVFVAVSCIFMMFVSCKGKTSKTSKTSKTEIIEPSEVVYNSLIQGFTSEPIGRKESVFVELTLELPSDAELQKHIKITPKVDGKWTISEKDPKVILFKPTTEFERGASYSVNMDMSNIFLAYSDYEDFKFSFKIVPTEAMAKFSTFKIDSVGNYIALGELMTSDYEDSLQVKNMTQWSGIHDNIGDNVEWAHSKDGRKHTFQVKGIPYKGDNRKLSLVLDDKKAGYERKEIFNLTVPNGENFDLYSIKYASEDEYYIEVLFTQMIEPGQDIEGLVWLSGPDIGCELEVEDNKILIYPDMSAISSMLNSGKNNKLSITVSIDGALQSQMGNKLQKVIHRKVSISSGKPYAEFLKGGVIVPPSFALSNESNPSSSVGSTSAQGIPFKAVCLRAVRVEVFRILDNSVGYFLQDNIISNNYPSSLISKTARPVASQIIFLDENKIGRKLRETNVYSLNLHDIIEPEIGALYYMTITYDRSMAILPSVTKREQLTKEGAKIADKARMDELVSAFDRGAYYIKSYYDWGDFNWRDTDNPDKNSYYYQKSSNRNLLVTDIGVIAKASNKPEMLFIVNSITTTKSIEGAKVELRNYQGVKVGEGVTNSDGEVLVKYDSGWPYYAVVSDNEQRTYLKVNAGTELSTSSFDVSGEQIKDGLRGFIWAERGVWRPGDTIHLNFVLSGNNLPKDHPVIIELSSPLGQLHQKQIVTKSVGGIYTFTLSTEAESQTGVWNATIKIGGATFVKRLRVEAIKPNRLKIDLEFKNDVIQRSEPLDAKLHGEWLTGANAGDLKYIIEVEFASARNTFKGYDGYSFYNNYKPLGSESMPEINGTTDSKGNADIAIALNGGSRLGGMVNANITTRLFEPSGEASIDAITMPYSPFKSYVGIKPPKGSDERLDTGKSYKFEIATVKPSGEIAPNRKVEVAVYKVSWHWWWSSERNQLANYVSNNNLTPIKTQTLVSSASGKVDYNLNIAERDWGVYYISARDVNSGHMTAMSVYMDWSYYGDRRGDSDNSSAMKLSVSLDKKEYNVGDKAIVSFPSTVGSRAIISVENGSDVLKTFSLDCSGENMKYTFDITIDMQPNVYINVTLLQPYGSVANDLPVRLYGVVPLTATSKESKLHPVLVSPDEVLPESEMEITVSEKNGRKFAYTLALVDEGLLDLTRFRTPNPWRAFNSRVALGISTWDIYNDVLGAYGGKIEQMFSIGGDDEVTKEGANGSVNRFPPIVEYVGTFELKAGEKRTHKVKLPAYLGRVRVMLVAINDKISGDSDAWGSTDKSIIVRSPLMVIGSAPRAVAPGDEIVIPATLIATKDGVGTVTTTIKVNKDMFTLIGDDSKRVKLEKEGDKIVSFRLKVNDSLAVGYGGSRIELIAKGGGKSSTYTMDIPMRELTMPITNGESYVVKAGETWSGETKLYGAPGTQKIMLEVSSVVEINSEQRMEYLSKYPYGCIEQITSAIFPILYLIDMIDLSPTERGESEAKVRLVMEKYKGYATPDGSMGYWPGNTSPSLWGSAYALHFMSVAKLKGYIPPSTVYENLKSSVKNMVVRWNASKNGETSLVQAYQLYALAVAGNPEFGAMNRLRQSENMTPEAKWMLAAAYATAGRIDIGKTVVAKLKAGEKSNLTSRQLQVQRNLTYGSTEREFAIQLLGASMLELDNESIMLSDMISKSLTSNKWMSTQTTAWSMMAIGTFATKNGKATSLDFTWSANGESGSVSSESKRTIWSKRWSNPITNKVSLTNKTTGPLHIRVVASGISTGKGIKSAANGIDVDVSYEDNRGNTINISQIKQGLDFVSVIKVKNTTSEAIYNVMLANAVASGFEIRPNGDLSLSSAIEYQDIRDDRVNSFIPVLHPGKTVTIKTRLNATYSGVYLLPSIRCAAMYNDKISGNTESGSVIID